MPSKYTSKNSPTCLKLREKKQVVCHTMALPFTLKKKYLKAKEEEELWKLKNISPCKNYNLLQKKSSKRNQNPSRYYNFITNLKV